EGSLVKLSAEKEAALIAEALVEAFEATDRAWLQAAKKKDLQEGSTGIVTLVSHGFNVPLEAKAPVGCAALWPKPKEEAPPEKQPGTVARAVGGVAKLFVAWAGDCRAVLLRGRRGCEAPAASLFLRAPGPSFSQFLAEGPPEVSKEVSQETTKEAKEKGETERETITIEDTPEGPIFRLDGETHRVLDLAALLEVGTVATAKPRTSLAEFKRDLKRRREEDAMEKP
ncbi:unnamed protein product, partial [Effrenium voratum]